MPPTSASGPRSSVESADGAPARGGEPPPVERERGEHRDGQAPDERDRGEHGPGPEGQEHERGKREREGPRDRHLEPPAERESGPCGSPAPRRRREPGRGASRPGTPGGRSPRPVPTRHASRFADERRGRRRRSRRAGAGPPADARPARPTRLVLSTETTSCSVKSPPVAAHHTLTPRLFATSSQASTPRSARRTRWTVSAKLPVSTTGESGPGVPTRRSPVPVGKRQHPQQRLDHAHGELGQASGEPAAPRPRSRSTAGRLRRDEGAEAPERRRLGRDHVEAGVGEARREVADGVGGLLGEQVGERGQRRPQDRVEDPAPEPSGPDLVGDEQPTAGPQDPSGPRRVAYASSSGLNSERQRPARTTS